MTIFTVRVLVNAVARVCCVTLPCLAADTLAGEWYDLATTDRNNVRMSYLKTAGVFNVV